METNPYAGISGLTTSQDVANQTNNDRTSLGQDQFLELMTQQLKNQDPMAPMDNGEFLGQIAQFGAVTGINDLNTSFNSFASSLQSSQALEASNLIGRQVLVDHDQAYLPDSGNLTGAVNLESSADSVAVNIYNSTGTVIGRVELGAQTPGLVPFNWDGVSLDGQRLSSGRYRVEVEAKYGNHTESLSPMVSANVASLTLGKVGQEMLVELENLGQIEFSQINQIL